MSAWDSHSGNNMRIEKEKLESLGHVLTKIGKRRFWHAEDDYDDRIVYKCETCGYHFCVGTTDYDGTYVINLYQNSYKTRYDIKPNTPCAEIVIKEVLT